MNLDEYNRKRNLSKTPEPSADINFSDQSKQLTFVIQKHKATHLHYDLRLEHKGVLKSWAIPKGPSLDPSQKRLAVQVEDHPYDYRNFEGVIPPGNYGAGTVMIWDEGTYTIPDCQDTKCTQDTFEENLYKGNLYFILHGKKIKGAFHLVQSKQQNRNNQWLLIKKTDSFSTIEDPLLKDKSVRSGRSLEEIHLQNTSNVTSSIDLSQLDLSGTSTYPLPRELITPMFAQLVARPFDKDDWFFEIKWDGYRAIAETRKSGLLLYSRRNNSFIDDYPQITHELKKFEFQAIFDGEIVALDKDGKVDFGTLQNYRRTRAGFLVYFIFDLLFLENHDLKNLPLYRRKHILKQILPSSPHIQYCDHIEKYGIAFFNAVKENQLEGIVAKDKNSPYQPGIRSHYWQKIKITMNQEFVIGGFTEPQGGRTGIGSLLIGVYENSDLIYAGNVGGGFSNDELPLVRKMLENIASNNSPFKSVNFSTSGVTWVRPELVCEVRFAEWTSEGYLRQPVFQGFRSDVPPENVRREKPSSLLSSDLKLSPPVNQDSIIIIDDIKIKITNRNKLYWPEQGLSKGDMIDYYRTVSKWILPHLKDRPQSLNRYPDGIYGKHFFHKDMDNLPDWVSSITLPSDIEGKSIQYLLCQNEASLIYMVNLGAIEINPWISRVGHLDNPDYMIIDLDPLECPFSHIIATAKAVHEILSEINAPHYIKTSGATGLHINVPLGTLYSYEQSRQFSMLICTLVNRRLPKITSMERMPEKRVGKVYLDYLQNIKGKTMAAPYCLRPRAGAPVSTPLLWEELRDDLKIENFTMHTIVDRLEAIGDLWLPVIGKGIDMQSSLGMLSEYFHF